MNAHAEAVIVRFEALNAQGEPVGIALDPNNGKSIVPGNLLALDISQGSLYPSLVAYKEGEVPKDEGHVGPIAFHDIMDHASATFNSDLAYVADHNGDMFHGRRKNPIVSIPLVVGREVTIWARTDVPDVEPAIHDVAGFRFTRVS